MSEHPIIFSAESVRAILAGAKTQTRRVIRPQPPSWLCDRREPWNVHNDVWGFVMPPEGGARAVRTEDTIRCPHGAIGDRQWVRETWAPSFAADDDSRGSGYVYRATNDGPEPTRWRSPIFMSRRVARILLDVVSVRVEQLQAITEDDARAEGVGPEFEVDAADFIHGRGIDFAKASTYRLGFKHGWDRINAKRGYHWASNPWIWRIEFRRMP